MAQDVKSQVDAITKVIVENKSNPSAYKDQVKDFVKEYKKNAEALSGLGRAFMEIKDTASAREYANMAIERGKDDKCKALASILLGDLSALASNEGGGAASYYNQAIHFDPKNPVGYIKYASVYRKVDPEGAVAKLEDLRKVDPTYPVDAEAAHFYYGANKLDKAVEYYGKVDLNQLKENYLTEYATAELLLANSKKSLEVSLFGVNKNPRSAAMNRITFYNYTDLKDYKNALKFADALFNNSDSAKISARDYQYGYALMGDSAYDRAIEEFKKALDMNAELNDVRKQLSDAYIAKKDFVNGLAYYDEYLSKIEKPSVPDLDGLAQLYMQQAAGIDTLNEEKVNAFKKADEIYGRIATDSPSNKLYATLMRARINSQLDPESTQGFAKPYYEEYAKLAEAENNPKLLIEPYLYLGYYYIVKEDNATAKSYFEKVAAIDPQNATAAQALSVLK